ncbi:MAG: cytochrome P450 [Pirellulaceae bacterium]|nr:cytochrome P450 [Pirellulaceae bacterium]
MSADLAWAKKIPPGPRGRLMPTLRIIRDPAKVFNQWVKQYGDPFLVNALNGPVVITGRADLIEEVFSGDPSHYEVFATKSMKPILGAGSLLMMDGDEHRRERKLMAPMFHGDRMKAYGQAMQEVARSVIEPIQVGATFQAIDVTTEISLQVIVRTVIGADQPETRRQIEQATRGVLDRTSPLLFFSPKTHFPFFGYSFLDRFTAARDRMHAVLLKELQSRGDSLATREDILSIMASTTYEDGQPIEQQHLFEEIGTMLFAGHETTAIALAWAFYHLHQHPQWLDRLRTEIRAAADLSPATLASLPLLKAIIAETLRLNPIITEMMRKLRTPMRFGDYELPAGFSIAPAPILAHYNAEVFEQPYDFNPQRFIDRKYTPSQYLPFGGGKRRCVGAAFSMYEMAIVLGTLLSENEFALCEPNPVVQKRRNITMGPSTGIKMRRL